MKVTCFAATAALLFTNPANAINLATDTNGERCGGCKTADVLPGLKLPPYDGLADAISPTRQYELPALGIKFSGPYSAIPAIDCAIHKELRHQPAIRKHTNFMRSNGVFAQNADEEDAEEE